MDLEYAPEYEAFRAQVRAFLEQHGADAPRSGIGGGAAGSRDRTLAYAADRARLRGPNDPREYGGYGGEPDLIAPIIAEEF